MFKKHNLYIKALLIVLSFFLLLALPSAREKTEDTIENIYSIIAGEIKPDSSIVIIHISEPDLERIGPWPIKRSYYALLINSLTKLNVSRIGLEVFLSSRLITQSIYDKLLKNEIEKAGNIVLGSLAGKITEHNEHFYTDSLSYPRPKLLNNDFFTGHLNYLRKNGIVIPLTIDNRGEKEKAFSYQLYSKNTDEKLIVLNFRSSWKKFRSFSLTEYFELVQKNDPVLKSLEGKIILIGISDPQIASTISTAFDEQLPGVALHAFALDNLLQSRWLRTGLYTVSGLVFILLLLRMIFIQPKIKAKIVYNYLFIFGLFIITTLILFTVFNQRAATSFFLFPFLLLLLSDIIQFIFEKNRLLRGAISEKEILQRLLVSKQEELSRFQKELNVSVESGSAGLIEKIKMLKSDIDKLRADEEDKTKAEIQFQTDVKNFYNIIYCSKAMDKVVDIIKKAAPQNATILIIGESGTGKELVAHAIHNLSERRERNFVAVNCAALTETLLESELFGHVKGAFTGASSDKIGKFEAADKGTIFLDEIGETSENFQVKLLRVLQSGEIEKVGSVKQAHVDVRIVAATNKELEAAVKEKRFREDLFYRLNVVNILLPPLRERKEDIEALTSYFLSVEAPGMNLSKAALKALLDYDWKGNIRELQSAVKRAVIFAGSEGRDMLRLSDLPKEIIKSSKYNFEDLVLESLRNKNFSHSSISETAKELGNVNRTMISENFRGIIFRTLYENNFDIDTSVDTIAGSNDNDVTNRVRAKIETFITNIETDMSKISANNFEKVKSSLATKYKNLPVKYHLYLDEIIRWKLKVDNL